jgi:hypothetical protein
MSFMQELEEALKEGEKNRKQKKKDPTFRPVPKVSLPNKIKGALGAFKRIRDKAKEDGKESVWISKREAIERQVCCTTCTNGGSCPYCGCNIKKSWFLPLGKSDLSTEGCPNKTTYPHLKKLPPKNYWQVCIEKTSILIYSNDAEYPSMLIDNLKKEATGEIEILVGLNYDLEDDLVKVFNTVKKGKREVVNFLAEKAEGKYLLVVDKKCTIEKGYDTKLKCICNDNTIASCVSKIGEEKKIGKYMDEDFNTYWVSETEEDEKIEKVAVCSPFFYMMQKDTFNSLGGMKEVLGSSANEELELSLNIGVTEGEVLVRTDLVCTYNGQESKNSEQIKHSKEILKYKWKDTFNKQYVSVNHLINKFGR